jgi:hypothetical protein
MDFLKEAASKLGGGQQQGQQQEAQSLEAESTQGRQQQSASSSGGGFLDGIGDKLNSAAGGGKESEKSEDYLDK